MTEERQERAESNGKKLTDITIWMIRNQEKWDDICLDSDPDGSKTTVPVTIMDELKVEGFMELYLVVLCKIKDLLDIGISEKFLLLLETVKSDDIPLDIDRIRKELLKEE